MKILLITHRYPPRAGGVETHVKEIATRLSDRDHDVAVFSADAGEEVSTKEINDGVLVRRFRSINPGEAFYFAPQMIPAIRRFEADILNAHNFHAFPMFFAAVGVTDERFVVTPHYHGKSASDVRDSLLSLYRPFGKWAIKQASEVIAVSEWEKTRLQEDFNVQATVIPNGVEIDIFANQEPEIRERPYLLSVGRLEKYKGVQHAIRALKELKNYNLVVAGSGPYQDELERIARKAGVRDRVEFLGYVNEKRLPKLYAGAEVFLNLSEFEAYGITVAEALAGNTPCVVREAGALVDWPGQKGCVGVENPTPLQVAAAVNDAAAARVEYEPTGWDTVTDQVLAIYANV